MRDSIMTTLTTVEPGAKFFTFQEFEQAFEKWKSENFHPFRVASSETLRMPDGTANEVFKYRYIVYHCAHYGAPRMRGAGKRPNQNYLPCGCRAMLRVNFSWSENVLRITTLNPIHTGHEVSADSYAKFSTKVRRTGSITPEEIRSFQSPVAPVKKEEALSPSPVLAKPIPTYTGKNTVVESPLALLLASGQKENSWTLANPLTLGYGLFGPPQSIPLDLTDKRTDEERFQEMHAILQGLTDSLMSCKGSEFDTKLRQLKNIYKSWSTYSSK